ncbi:MAG: RnfABCDGE type electron transport complex subunit B [Solobacterium sp.]|nr:RnfABCDGE type electron transport complex subunit B [Solobacterium sp.]
MIKAVVMMLALGAIVGLVLGFAATKFHVEPDHREEELLAMLPGYNCGGCGYPGCSGMAAALADGSGNIDKCKPSKADVKEAIKQYLKDHPKEA